MRGSPATAAGLFDWLFLGREAADGGGVAGDFGVGVLDAAGAFGAQEDGDGGVGALLRFVGERLAALAGGVGEFDLGGEEGGRRLQGGDGGGDGGELFGGIGQGGGVGVGGGGLLFDGDEGVMGGGVPGEAGGGPARGEGGGREEGGEGEGEEERFHGDPFW